MRRSDIVECMKSDRQICSSQLSTMVLFAGDVPQAAVFVGTSARRACKLHLDFGNSNSSNITDRF